MLNSTHSLETADGNDVSSTSHLGSSGIQNPVSVCVRKEWRIQGSCSSLVGAQKQWSLWKMMLTAPYKANYSLSDPAVTVQIFNKTSGSSVSTQLLTTALLTTGPNQRATNMPFKETIEKWTVICLDNRVSFSSRKPRKMQKSF